MKPEITPTKILGLPLVINEEMEPGIVFCFDGEDKHSQTGGLELHCRRDTYEQVLSSPEKRGLVAMMVAKVKQALAVKQRRERQDAFWKN